MIMLGLLAFDEVWGSECRLGVRGVDSMTGETNSGQEIGKYNGE